MKPSTNLHYCYEYKQPELFPVPIDEVNADLNELAKFQGDDICEYI